MKRRPLFPPRAKGKRSRFWPWFFAIMLFIILFIFSSLGSLRIFLPYYPEISGLPFGSRNYLIVFQNNHELRPAGGFISAYGIAKFRYGFFTGLDMADVYGDIDEHAFMEPPYPMRKLLANRWYKGYTFRDANFNPDFPKTAQELTRMLQITKPNLQVSGVIAVNYSFLENLLGSLGQIEVNGKIFSRDNLFEALEYEVNNIDQHNPEELKNRKGILKSLASAIIKKILLNPFKLRKASDTIVHSLTAKEIQFYFSDPSLEKLMMSQGWAGEWPKITDSDFLAVNEANLGGMKSDRYLQRKVTYHLKVEQDPATGQQNLVGDVLIDLYHFGIENIPLSGSYTGFIRTYVPKGAILLDITPAYKADLWQADDGDLHIFGNIVRLNPGNRIQLHYRYSLPPNLLVRNNYYRLFIPKQSGISDDYYTIITEFPQGLRVEGESFTSRENFGVYQNELNADLNLHLNVLPDKAPPRITSQAIDHLGEITIVFNEDISDASAKDPLNYEITDRDFSNKNLSDHLQLDHIEHSGKGVTLFVKGMSVQPEEHYSIVLQNIADLHGNIIDPNPKTITAVQRLR